MNELLSAIVSPSQTQLSKADGRENLALKIVNQADNLFNLTREKGLNEQNALQYAINYKNTEVALAIIEKLDEEELFNLVAQQDGEGRNAMHCAVWLVAPDVAVAIIKKLSNERLLAVLRAKDIHQNNVLHMFMLWNYRLIEEHPKDGSSIILDLESIIDFLLIKQGLIFKDLANQKNVMERYPSSLPKKAIWILHKSESPYKYYIIDGKRCFINTMPKIIQQNLKVIQKKLRRFYHFEEAYSGQEQGLDASVLSLVKLTQEALKSEFSRAKFEVFITNANEIIQNPDKEMIEKQCALRKLIRTQRINQDASMSQEMQRHIQQYNQLLTTLQEIDIRILMRQIPQCAKKFDQLCEETQVDESLKTIYKPREKEKGKQSEQVNGFKEIQTYLENKAKESDGFFEIQKKLGFDEASKKAYVERLVHFYYLYQILNLISKVDKHYPGVVEALKKYVKMREIQFYATKSKLISTERYMNMIDELSKLSDVELWEQFNTFNQSFNLEEFVGKVNAVSQEQEKRNAKQEEAKNPQFNIALYGIACFFDQKAVRAVLNRENIEVELKTIDSLLLNFYVYENNVEMVRFLLDKIYAQYQSIDEAKNHIADYLEHQDKWGNTAWHYLCKNLNIEMVSLLINSIDHNRLTKSWGKQNNQENTPLHLICSRYALIMARNMSNSASKELAQWAVDKSDNDSMIYDNYISDYSVIETFINSVIHLLITRIGSKDLYKLLQMRNLDNANILHLLTQFGSTCFVNVLRNLVPHITPSELHDLMLKSCSLPVIDHYQITDSKALYDLEDVVRGISIGIMSITIVLIPLAIVEGTILAAVKAKQAADGKLLKWDGFELAKKHANHSGLEEAYNQIFCFIQLEQYFLKNAEKHDKPAFQSKYNAYKNLYKYLKNNIVQARNSKQERDDVGSSSQAIENKSEEFNLQHIGEMKAFIKGMLANKDYTSAFSSYVGESEFKAIFTQIANLPDNLFARVVEDHLARYPTDQRLMTEVEKIVENKKNSTAQSDIKIF